MDKMKFNRGNPQEEGPKRIEKKKSRKWLVLGIIALAAVAVVGVSLLRDSTAFDGLRRSIIYARAEKDQWGCAQLYSYSSDRDSCYASLGGSLVCASNNTVVLLGEDGSVRYSADVQFKQAAVCTNGSVAVVYDIGGTSLYVLDSKGLVRTLTAQGEIIACTVNAKGALAITSSKTGYKAAVEVYDGNGEKVFAFHSSDRFLMTAAVSDDSQYLAAVTMGQQDGSFLSTAVLYRMDSDVAVADCTIPGGAVYDIGTVDGRFCLVGESGLTFLNTAGEITGSCDYEGTYLRRCSLAGDGMAVLVLGRYRSGTQAQLLTVDESGAVLGRLDIDRDVVSLSAAGKYVAVLYSDALVIYDRRLQEYARLTEISAVKQVLMRSDGSAVLVSAGGASLYLP